jgi:DNA-binding MarR family transcriptional regulator
LDVAGKLTKEIKQTKPFVRVEEEAFLNVLITAEVLSQRASGVLKEFGLSLTQYNVLRILRGAGADGLACSQVGERMITKEPDITRLFDRMQARGLLARERASEDRRVVVTKITNEGLALLDQVSEPVMNLLHSTMGTIGKPELLRLIDQLESVREVWN